MKAKVKVKYPFTANGIAAFKDDTLNDIFDEMDKGGEKIGDFDIFLTIGDRTIRIPTYAEIYEAMTIFLERAQEEGLE